MFPGFSYKQTHLGKSDFLDLGGGRNPWLLQVNRSSVGPADPLHHDQVRMLRTHRGGHIQARRAQAESGVQQARATGVHVIKIYSL